jgi:hypothetical protein
MPGSPAHKHSPQPKPSLPKPTVPGVQWFCRVFDTELGPLTFATLCEMIKTGQVGPDDQVRASDACFWQPACRVSVLQSVLAVDGDAAKNDGVFVELTTNAPLPDEWFYRLDDRERGPFKFAVLQELIGSSGQTAEQVVIRQAGSDEWTPFYQLPDNSGLARPQDSRANRDATERAAFVPLGGVESSAATKVVTSVAPWTPRQFISDNRDILVVVAVWALVNVGALVAWSDPYSTERKYFRTMRQLEEKVHSLQTRDASPDEWKALRLKAKEALAPIVADLKKTASASHPIRQHLLWAARDQMPKIIRPDRQETEVDRLYKAHMEFVEGQLRAP